MKINPIGHLVKTNPIQTQYKPNTNPIKPNYRKAKMNVNSLITKDYRKKDDFVVRINKPNFFKGPKCTQTSLLQRIMKMKPPSGPKKQTQNKPNSNPIKACPVAVSLP